jgi:hypothetical protein
VLAGVLLVDDRSVDLLDFFFLSDFFGVVFFGGVSGTDEPVCALATCPNVLPAEKPKAAQRAAGTKIRSRKFFDMGLRVRLAD